MAVSRCSVVFQFHIVFQKLLNKIEPTIHFFGIDSSLDGQD